MHHRTAQQRNSATAQQRNSATAQQRNSATAQQRNSIRFGRPSGEVPTSSKFLCRRNRARYSAFSRIALSRFSALQKNASMVGPSGICLLHPLHLNHKQGGIMKFSLFPKSIPIEYQKLISQICAVSIMIALLNGCSILTSPKENPVIEEHANNLFDMKRMGTLSTTAERREVIFKFPDNQFCAEPSPDVAESLTSSLSLMAQASVNKTGDATKDAAIDAKLQLSKELATSIRHLFQRTQGVQFFRDGLFNLCIAKMNGTITQEEYKTFYEKLVTHSVNLISEELKLRPVTPPSP